MKILAVGDFHGKVPRFLTKVVKKEKPDIIISQGDFHPMTLRKEFFKYSFGEDIELWQILGKKKVKEAELRDDKRAIKVLDFLYNLNIPIYFCTGNWDRAGANDIWYKKSGWNFYDKDKFKNIIKPFKKNLHRIDFKRATFSGFDIVGYPNCNWPGLPRKAHLKGKTYTVKVKTIIRRHNLFKKRLSKLFKEAKNPAIFIPHNVPYGLKMSIIKAKDAHKLAKGHHYGSILVRDLIRKYQPLLCICGHMHENQGVAKIGKTKVVNCGYGAKGEYAIINLTPKRVRVKFFKKEK